MSALHYANVVGSQGWNLGKDRCLVFARISSSVPVMMFQSPRAVETSAATGPLFGVLEQGPWRRRKSSKRPLIVSGSYVIPRTFGGFRGLSLLKAPEITRFLVWNCCVNVISNTCSHILLGHESHLSIIYGNSRRKQPKVNWKVHQHYYYSQLILNPYNSQQLVKC